MQEGRKEKRGGGREKKEDMAVEGTIGNTGRLTFFGYLIHVLPTDGLY